MNYSYYWKLDYAVISGVPGTGKTATVNAVRGDLEKSYSNKVILIVYSFQ